MIKNLVSIFSLLIIISFCLSCDGRDRVHKSAETVLKKNKLLDSFSEQTVYIPDGYAEKVTDTIFANGHHVYIKQYINDLKEITVNSKDKKNPLKTTYKDFKVDVKVTLKNELLYEKTLTSSSEIIFESFFNSDVHDYIIRNAWTDSSEKYNHNSPYVLIELYNPNTLDYKNLKLDFLKGKILTTTI